jgi:hypothetical protein
LIAGTEGKPTVKNIAHVSFSEKGLWSKKKALK